MCAAIHEITHAKLHNYEQERIAAAQGMKTKEPTKPKDRATEEVEAESVSYAVCQYYGIETSANSFGYIATGATGKNCRSCEPALKPSTRRQRLITDVDLISGRFVGARH